MTMSDPGPSSPALWIVVALLVLALLALGFMDWLQPLFGQAAWAVWLAPAIAGIALLLRMR